MWRTKSLKSCWIALCISITRDEVEKYAKIMQSNSSHKYVHCYDFEILNLFDPKSQVINTKAMIKDKLKKNVK